MILRRRSDRERRRAFKAAGLESVTYDAPMYDVADGLGLRPVYYGYVIISVRRVDGARYNFVPLRRRRDRRLGRQSIIASNEMEKRP